MVMIQNDFEDKLKYGQEGEVFIQNIFMKMGWFVMPKYLYVKKGAPSLIGVDVSYAVPDLDIASQGDRFWIEVKRKTLRTTYPDTGFAERLVSHYIEVQKITGNKVFVIFIDERLNICYGNWLNNLLQKRVIYLENKNRNQTYPWSSGGFNHRGNITYFPYPDAFRDICSVEELGDIPHFKMQIVDIFKTKQRKLSVLHTTKQVEIFKWCD